MVFKQWVHDVLKDFGYLVPAAMGGVVDYLNQIQRGAKHWSVFGFIGHMSAALFFGWLAGVLMSEFYESSNLIAASGGMGGFLGVRLADLIVYKIFKVDRRTK